MSERRVADDTLQQARDAISRHAWREAYDLLNRADASESLCSEDLDRLSDCGWWTGRIDDSIEARERAYAAYIEAGQNPQAARAAIRLFATHYQRQKSSVAMGWLSRAVRLLQGEPECPEHGYLSWVYTNVAVGTGDLDGALEHAAKTLDIGNRFGDRDLQAIGLFDQGNVLVAKGQVEEGMALLDEAMVGAVSGELGPLVTGTIYCAMITTCQRLTDYRRAAEWTDAAQRWCGRQSISGFPGLCRVHRAQIMRLRGAWAKAEEEATLARDELRDFEPEAA